MPAVKWTTRAELYGSTATSDYGPYFVTTDSSTGTSTAIPYYINTRNMDWVTFENDGADNWVEVPSYKLKKDEKMAVEEAVKNAISRESKKAAKAELAAISKKVTALEKRAGTLRTDITALTKERKAAETAMAKLKEEMAEERRQMEEMLEKYAEKIFRFQIMDTPA